MTMGSLDFSEAARQMGHIVRAEGYRVPTFRSPPRRPGQTRSIRRWPDGSVTVAVALRGRAPMAVLADMIDGVLAANDLAGREAGALRERLWEGVSRGALAGADCAQSGLSLVGSGRPNRRGLARRSHHEAA